MHRQMYADSFVGGAADSILSVAAALREAYEELFMLHSVDVVLSG